MSKRCFFLWILFCLTSSHSETAAHYPRIVLIGDSTVSDYPTSLAPLTGWGQALREQLRNQAYVVNYAVPGSSTLRFYNKHWKNVLSNLKSGDCLLIQFGHIDALPAPEHHVDLNFYRSILIQFITEARRVIKVQPILVTPISQYHFLQGKVVNTHSDYHSIMQNVSHEMKVPLIDLNLLSANSMEQLGEYQSRSWFMIDHDGHDTVHLTRKGAQNIAVIVASLLKSYYF